MARAIIQANGKRHAKSANQVTAVVGVVAGGEYYELAVNAYDDGEQPGGIIVTKLSTKDPTNKPKEVYRVPRKPVVRKKASKEPSTSTVDSSSTT